jgi:DNA polymerase I-like protein with 3'-5' exonuclease and polymerase domains
MSIFYDTMLAAHCLGEERGLSLLNQASTELGVDDWGKGTHSFGDAKTPPDPLWGPDGLAYYNARDAGYTHLLYEAQRDQLVAHQDQARLMKLLAFPGMNAVCQMELNGIWVDLDRLEKRREELLARREAARIEMLQYVSDDFRESADFANEHFLRRWIFGQLPDGLGLEPVSFTEKTQKPQVDEAALTALSAKHPAMEVLMRFRRATKHVQFLDGWKTFMDRGHRLHPRFNMTGTVTGRRSCSDPNLQQVPRDKYIRSIIGAPPGWRLLEIDYSQIEVRLSAWFAEEDTMLALYADDKDVYIHIASLIYEKPESEVTRSERQGAKAVVLGFLYGMGPRSFVIYAKETFDVDFTLDQGRAFRETFFSAYPRLLPWHDRQRKLVRQHLQVSSPIGRVRHLKRVLSLDEFTRAKAERQAINSPVQGFGGDLTLATNLSLMPELDPEECLVVGDIHDALLFQVRDDVWEKWAHRILTVMQDPPALSPFNANAPVRFLAEGKIGQHWGQGLEFLLKDFGPDGTLPVQWHEEWEKLLAGYAVA